MIRIAKIRQVVTLFIEIPDGVEIQDAMDDIGCSWGDNDGLVDIIDEEFSKMEIVECRNKYDASQDGQHPEEIECPRCLNTATLIRMADGDIHIECTFKSCSYLFDSDGFGVGEGPTIILKLETGDIELIPGE